MEDAIIAAGDKVKRSKCSDQYVLPQEELRKLAKHYRLRMRDIFDACPYRIKYCDHKYWNSLRRPYPLRLCYLNPPYSHIGK